MAKLEIFFIFLNILLYICCSCSHDVEDNVVFETTSQNKLNVGQSVSSNRYLIYDVNPGEGFNLRRDVYMRVANLIKMLNDDASNWTLVVPPWRHLYHWKTPDLLQNALPWRTFFDMKSLNRYVPVIEFEDFVNETGGARIEETIYLQRYKEGWTDGKWEEKIDDRECLKQAVYHKVDDVYRGYFWGLDVVFSEKFRCMSVQGLASILKPLLKNSHSRSIFIDRFEEVLHIEYGQVEYWKARRSMVFAKHLRKAGNKYRKAVLKSDDEGDSTVMKYDWRKNKKAEGSAKGGPYLAVHLRRADFLYARAKQVPSLHGAVEQIKKILKEHELDVVFLATDASKEDIDYLKARLPVVRYEPSKTIHQKYGDGGVAIIDQWICAHAQYFVGTKESTFSFRIQEERDILGFHADATFNCLCPDDEIGKCEQPTRWRIVY